MTEINPTRPHRYVDELTYFADLGRLNPTTLSALAEFARSSGESEFTDGIVGTTATVRMALPHAIEHASGEAQVNDSQEVSLDPHYAEEIPCVIDAFEEVGEEEFENLGEGSGTWYYLLLTDIEDADRVDESTRAVECWMSPRGVLYEERTDTEATDELRLVPVGYISDIDIHPDFPPTVDMDDLIKRLLGA